MAAEPLSVRWFDNVGDAVFAGERVVGTGDMVGGRFRMLMSNRIDSRESLVSQTNPAGRTQTMSDGTVQRLLKRIAQVFPSA